MNRDKELLERAAEAAGIEFAQVWPKSCKGKPRYWNPLDDDGDALRLAVKLGIWITDTNTNEAQCTFDSGKQLSEPYNDDPMEATRRAIVRAAAEMEPR